MLNTPQSPFRLPDPSDVKDFDQLDDYLRDLNRFLTDALRVTPNSKEVSGNILTTDTDYVMSPDNFTVCGKELTEDITITLPNPGQTEGNIFNIKNADNTYKLLVTGPGTTAIDGVTTGVTLKPLEHVSVISDGTSYTEAGGKKIGGNSEGFVSKVVYVDQSDSPVTIDEDSDGSLYSVDTSGGNVTFNLPDISTVDLPYNVAFKKETSDDSTVTINTGGLDEFDLDGVTTHTLAEVGAVRLAPSKDKTPNRWVTLDLFKELGTFSIDSFNGDGTQTAFTLSGTPVVLNNIWLTVNGVRQLNGVDFTLSGSTITLSTAPPTGSSNILVQYGQANAIDIGTASAVDNNLIATTPMAESGVDDTKLMTPLRTKQAIDALEEKPLGVGQTWTDVTASRSSGVTYTNSTGRSIVVQVKGEASNFILITASIDGGPPITVGTGNRSSGTTGGAGNIIVQPGSTYSLSIPGLIKWHELR